MALYTLSDKFISLIGKYNISAFPKPRYLREKPGIRDGGRFSSIQQNAHNLSDCAFAISLANAESQIPFAQEVVDDITAQYGQGLFSGAVSR